MKRILGLLLLVSVLFSSHEVLAKPVDRNVIQKVARYWIQSKPVFKQAVGKAPGLNYRIERVSRISLDGADYPAFSVELRPRGYLIIAADDELPTVISYSANSLLDLSPEKNNSFRQILMKDLKAAEKNLKNRLDRRSIQFRGKNQKSWKKYQYASAAEISVLTEDANLLYELPPQSVIVVDELMQTRWNQNRHYNDLTPESVDVSAYFNGHVPTGCVATAFAQVMKYHNWPWYGEGGHSYSDSSGTVIGAHAVAFSDDYDWPSMLNDYDPWNDEPVDAVAAVAELIYEAGVASEMNYEANGSSSWAGMLHARLASQFYYQQSPAVNDSAAAMTDALVQNMAERTPCVASIPGHAVVVDGHSTEGGDDYLHINYGWGGDNNGWYLLNGIPGGGVSEVYPGNRPQEVPLLKGQNFGGGFVEIKWAFPEYYQDAVESVRLFEGQMQFADTLFDSGADFSQWQPVDENSDLWVSENDRFHWSAKSDSGVFSSGQNPLEFHSPIIPSENAMLVFDIDATFSDEWFGVEISTDQGESWQVLRSWTATGGGGVSETSYVDLSAYAGIELYLRFNAVFSSGSYYPTGGVWLDNIELTNVQRIVFQEKVEDTDVDLAEKTIQTFSLTAGQLYYTAQVFQGGRWSELSPAISLVNSIDATPDAFAFVDQTDVSLNKLVVSNSVTAAGIDVETPIAISGGEYSIDDGLFTDSPGTVGSGQNIHVRLLSSAAYSTTSSTELTIGGISDSFNVTTFGAELDADQDGLADFEDNCPATANNNQSDANGNGIGDACDGASDSDSDGFTDAEEALCESDPSDPTSRCNRAMPWLMLLLEDE